MVHGAGVIVEAIKKYFALLIQGSLTGVPVGQVANFIAGCLFILPEHYIFQSINQKKFNDIGLIAGTITMTVIMSVLNYFIILPAYTWFLNAPAMSSDIMRQTIVTAILPFNVIKGIVVTIVFVALFSRLKVWVFAKMKNA